MLNGYEELENFHDLDECELDYLGITENEQRAKILAAVELLQDSNTCKSLENSRKKFRHHFLFWASRRQTN